jgi:uncharacterized protein
MDSVVHFEIPYDESERVESFYREVFGWKVSEVPDMNYHIAHTTEIDKDNMPINKGAINGGFYKRGDEGAKSPVVVINVENLNQSIEKVEKEGGKVVMSKRKVGNMGYYCQVEDTEGNVIGIWENIIEESGKEKVVGESEGTVELENVA